MTARTQRYSELAAKGMTARQIADECGVTYAVVKGWSRQCKVALVNEKAPSQTARYAELAAQGMTGPEIARECNTDRSNVNAWANLNGVILPGSKQFFKHLTPAERADYDMFKRASYTRNEALTAIGRADLIKEERT